MKYNEAVLRITISLLCVVLLLNGLTLNAAGSAEELRHEAFLRGGEAIRTALNTPVSTPTVSKAVENSIPSAPVPPAPAPQSGGSSSRMSPKMWGLLIGGFAVSGILVYKQATGPGASVKNCSTCSK